jgi:hypothetical protein
MAGLLASVPRKILGMPWDQHHQMSILSKNFVYILYNHEIVTLDNYFLSVWSNKLHCTHLLQIMGWLETPAICSNTWKDSSWVEGANWLLLIPFWLEANYIFLRTSHFFALSSSRHYAPQPIMTPLPCERAESGSKSSRPTGPLSNLSPG